MLTIDRWGPNGEEELSTLRTEAYLPTEPHTY